MPLLERQGIAIDCLDRGAGPPILLLHSAGMGAAQWRPLMNHLAESFRCLAPNQRGYARSAAWPARRPAEIDAECALVEALLETVPGAVDVVGHSMGAWLALELATRRPARVGRLALIEPVVLGSLRSEREAAALGEVGAMIEAVLAHFEAGDVGAAMERFTDYWYGAGAWAKLPLAQRLPIFAKAEKMESDVRAVWADTAPLARWQGVDRPALVLSAERTTPAARRMAELLAGALPRARHETIAGAGHMAPVTHAAELAPRLTAFLAGG
jgi:pimeloyl-ACP methyl ester carboxylesterase